MSDHCRQCNSILDDYDLDSTCQCCAQGGMFEYNEQRYYRTAIEEGFTQEEMDAEDAMDASELFEILKFRGDIKEIE